MSAYRTAPTPPPRSRLWRFRMWLARLVAPCGVESVDVPPSAGIEPTWYPPLPVDAGDRISLPVEHIAAADGVNVKCACWMCEESRARTVEYDASPGGFELRAKMAATDGKIRELLRRCGTTLEAIERNVTRIPPWDHHA